MKKQLIAIAASLAASVVLATGVHADFAKSKDYTDGMFTDVPSGEWYAASVKDAYEYGIMQGDSGTTFSPNGTLTVDVSFYNPPKGSRRKWHSGAF